MQYGLTDEQVMLKDTVRRLAREQLAPGAAQRDARSGFAWDAKNILQENGLMGCDFKEEYGGAQMGMLAPGRGHRGDSQGVRQFGGHTFVPRTGLHAHHAGRLFGAEEEMDAWAGFGGKAGLLRAHRAGGRIGRGRASHQGGEKRR